VRQEPAQKPSGLLVAQLLPCGVTRAKRGVYRAGTITPRAQGAAALTHQFEGPAGEPIILAAFEPQDGEVYEDLSRPIRHC